MEWREYEILGAFRDSGEPARLRVEAASEDDAIEYAASRGVLISRVEDRTEQAGSTTDPRTEPRTDPRSPPRNSSASSEDIAHGSDRIRLRSKAVPDLDLEHEERILLDFAARPREIGLRAMVLGGSRRLIITDRRLVAFERTPFHGASVRTVRRERIDAICAGPHTWLAGLIIGGVIAALSSVMFIWAGVLVALQMIAVANAPAGLQLPGWMNSAVGIWATVAAMPFLIGLAIVRASRRRFIGAIGGGERVGIYVRRVGPDRLSPILRAIEHAPEPRE